MQTAIREQVDALLHLGVIEVGYAPIWSQVHQQPRTKKKRHPTKFRVFYKYHFNDHEFSNRLAVGIV